MIADHMPNHETSTFILMLGNVFVVSLNVIIRLRSKSDFRILLVTPFSPNFRILLISPFSPNRYLVLHICLYFYLDFYCTKVYGFHFKFYINCLGRAFYIFLDL